VISLRYLPPDVGQRRPSCKSGVSQRQAPRCAALAVRVTLAPGGADPGPQTTWRRGLTLVDFLPTSPRLVARSARCDILICDKMHVSIGNNTLVSLSVPPHKCLLAIAGTHIRFAASVLAPLTSSRLRRPNPPIHTG